MQISDLDSLISAFAQFHSFAVIDREAVARAVGASNEEEFQIFMRSKLLPEATYQGQWSIPHIQAHLGRLAAERDKHRLAKSPSAVAAPRLINEAGTLAALGCDRVELYRKIVAGELPTPFLARGVENVWRYDDVIKARR